MKEAHAGTDPGGTVDLLAGIRVLDLSSMLAGPYCSYQLALLGAEVTKVEAPGDGDLTRLFGADAGLARQRMGVSFLAQNAGKRSIVLNLKDDADRETFRQLVAASDVLLENFRPGVLERLGFGYDVLQSLRPGLIYCAISGFGATGPLRHRPAYDQIIQGYAGMMSVTGEAAGSPLRAGFPICDTLGGLTGAFAICAAITRQQRTGQGAFLDVSILEAAVSALGWAASNYLVAGVEPGRLGNDNVAASPSGLFGTADGGLNIAANKQEQFEALCGAIGRPELAADPRFAIRAARLENRVVLKAELETTLRTRGSAEWEDILARAGVPAGRVLSVPEILHHPQLAERGMVTRFGAEDTGLDRELSVLRGGFLVDGVAPCVGTPPSALDADREAVLAELRHDASLTATETSALLKLKGEPTC